MMNTRRISAALVTAAAFATPQAAQAATYDDSVLADQPLTYLRMSESAGPTAADESPNNRDGVYAGAFALGVSGPFTQAGTAVGLAKGARVTVDGVDRASGSVQLWVKPDRLRRGEQAGYVSHGDPSGDGWALGVGAGSTTTVTAKVCDGDGHGVEK